MNSKIRRITPVCAGALLVMFSLSCEKESNPLAPYGGGRRALATIIVQDSTFTPKITWVGGFVSVLGINRGGMAILDTSLAWIVRSAGDALHYPVTVGQLPAGAEDLTSSFGSLPAAKLIEDQLFTFWVMKDQAWVQLSSLTNKRILPDSSASAGVRVQGDTVFVAPTEFTLLTDTTDIFVNINNVDARGRLGTMTVTETDTSNNPLIEFVITQTTDTAVAAVGLVYGTAVYDVNRVIWEVLSEDTTGGPPVYRTKNIIASPLIMGQAIPGTRAFTVYPSRGLERGEEYYCWIATKDWDGNSRTRTANYYASVTFRTR